MVDLQLLYVYSNFPSLRWVYNSCLSYSLIFLTTVQEATESPDGYTIPPFLLGIGGAAIVLLVIILAVLGRSSKHTDSHVPLTLL